MLAVALACPDARGRYTSPMQHRWFRRFGWLYRPISPMGWLITLLAFTLTVNVFLAIDRHSHSASDTLYGVFPYAALFAIITIWIASHTSAE